MTRRQSRRATAPSASTRRVARRTVAPNVATFTAVIGVHALVRRRAPRHALGEAVHVKERARAALDVLRLRARCRQQAGQPRARERAPAAARSPPGLAWRVAAARRARQPRKRALSLPTRCRARPSSARSATPARFIFGPYYDVPTSRVARVGALHLRRCVATISRRHTAVSAGRLAGIASGKLLVLNDNGGRLLPQKRVRVAPTIAHHQPTNGAGLAPS